MEIEKIFEAILTPAEDGTSATIVSLSHQVFDEGSNSLSTQKEHSVLNPIVNIDKLGELTRIELVFEHAGDSDLRIFWQIIKDCEDRGSCLYDEADGSDYDVIGLSLIPEAFNGQYFVSAAMPLDVSLKATEPSQPASVLCLIFNSEDVVFCATDDIDIAAIESEVERELAEEERIADIEEQRRQEREEAEERRNRLLQQRRGY